jgi:hypothetical protein
VFAQRNTPAPCPSTMKKLFRARVIVLKAAWRNGFSAPVVVHFLD